VEGRKEEEAFTVTTGCSKVSNADTVTSVDIVFSQLLPARTLSSIGTKILLLMKGYFYGQRKRYAVLQKCIDYS